jgi:preprotein translocase subunit SecF
MSLISLSRIFLPVSVLLVLAGLLLMFKPGPQLSIEFTGGTLMELQIPENRTRDELITSLRSFPGDADLQNASVLRTKTETYFVRSATITNEQHTELMSHLESTLGNITELQYTTIGPTVGESLKYRAFWALAAALLAIIIYIAFAFRKIPRSLSPWTFGSAAIIALIHDVIVILGIFTILSHYTTFQMDTLFVSAVLSIMGYSVSDTIVIFDRIRDNLAEEGKRIGDFGEIADRSLKQSISRTLNTGLGALIMLFALFFFGSESIRWFMLALIIGTVVGTYSSFFIATPLLVLWKNRQKN